MHGGIAYGTMGAVVSFFVAIAVTITDTVADKTASTVLGPWGPGWRGSSCQ